MVEELLGLALLILIGKILEEVFVRLGYPPLVGWALAGILLGPSLLGLAEPTSHILLLTSIGVYIFFFLIGLEEIDVEGVVSSVNIRHIVIPVIATIANILLVVPAGLLLQLDVRKSLALAVISAIPTSSVVAKTLSDMGRLKSREGISVFSYILSGELIALLFATTLLELGGSEVISVKGILLQLGEMAFYFVVAGWVSVFVIPKLVRGVKLYMLSEGALTGVIFGLILLFVGVGEKLGVHGVVGSLILGLVLSDALLEEETRGALEAVKRIGNGVFIPLFFASIGLRFAFSSSPIDPVYALFLVFLLVPFRVGLHYVFSRLAGMAASREIAASLMARGAVDLAILGPFLDAGLIDTTTYSIIVATSIATLILYPFVAKKIYAAEVPEKIESLPLMPLIARQIMGMMKVKDVMVKPVKVRGSTSVGEARKLMEEKRVDCLLVEDGEPRIVLLEDLRRVSDDDKVEEHARSVKLLVEPGENLYRVLEEIALTGEKVAVVKGRDGKIIGIVSPHTVLKKIVLGGRR